LADRVEDRRGSGDTSGIQTLAASSEVMFQKGVVRIDRPPQPFEMAKTLE
jgi:hypothetical protein